MAEDGVSQSAETVSCPSEETIGVDIVPAVDAPVEGRGAGMEGGRTVMKKWVSKRRFIVRGVLSHPRQLAVSRCNDFTHIQLARYCNSEIPGLEPAPNILNKSKNAVPVS
jgi:hypothetical protein